MPRLAPVLAFAALASTAATSLAGPVAAQPAWAPAPADSTLIGPGVRLLIPELRDTARGQAFVRRRFDFNGDGVVQRDEALAANRAFLDRRGRDDRWDDRAEPPPPPAPPPPEVQPRYAPGEWDRSGMRSYAFRQNRYGAVFNIGDVLFDTGSARLRSEAQDRLRPLAGYLRAHPNQKVRIDGFTDSVGTAQANLILSRDRARSVADLLAAEGAGSGQFQMEGHGEDSPVASNTSADGRQQNRRVEVTLVGRRVEEFR